MMMLLRNLRGANARTNFELPQSGNNGSGVGRVGGSNFVLENAEPFSFEEVCGTGEQEDGLLGALKAKLFDGKILYLPRSPVNYAGAGAQSGVASTPSSSHRNSLKRQLSSPAEAPHDVGFIDPMKNLSDNLSNTSGKSVLSDYDQQGVILDDNVGVNCQRPCQSTSTTSTTWSNNGTTYELPWSTQMNHVPDQNGLFASPSATTSWSLPGLTESTVNFTYSDNFLTNSKSGRTNTFSSSMQFSPVGGVTEVIWPPEQQSVHGENSSWFGSNSSWDPLLYVTSELG
ncbi:putative AP2/ERF domain-containing transcription factor [Quillaja saponaria]|uniref:AP2/ERF domain-containing transcription factor n=1 Tax=Quillaja saponaria TaxID=32244 RepID=A0AAD7KXX2_QUISA|nr:putative AP2/ERF domain-containing transcription factor [Quillaja saponaria]